MHHRTRPLVGVAAAASVAGCAMWNPFLPDTRTPADRAQALMHKCVNESGENPGVNPAAIEEVRPLITTVASNNDSAIHLRGAELQLRPIASLSPEGLQRTLECHQALVTLGRAAPFPDDPYVLDGAWLGLKVRSDGDAFIVTIQTDVLDEARTVLERARAYGARAGQVASAPAPAASSSAP